MIDNMKQMVIKQLLILITDSEQQKIAKQLAAIEHQIKTQDCAFSAISDRLRDVMDLIEDCGETYRLASDHIKRMMNQAIFSKLWVEDDGRITAELTSLFATALKPSLDTTNISGKQKIRSAEALTDFLSVISNRIQKFFGCGWSNDLLVREAGAESVLCKPAC